MEKLYKVDKISAEEIVKDFREEEKREEASKWINVGVVDKDTPREEVTNLLREAVIKARELANKKGE